MRNEIKKGKSKEIKNERRKRNIYRKYQRMKSRNVKRKKERKKERYKQTNKQECFFFKRKRKDYIFIGYIINKNSFTSYS